MIIFVELRREFNSFSIWERSFFHRKHLKNVPLWGRDMERKNFGSYRNGFVSVFLPFIRFLSQWFWINSKCYHITDYFTFQISNHKSLFFTFSNSLTTSSIFFQLGFHFVFIFKSPFFKQFSLYKISFKSPALLRNFLD